MTIGSLCVSGCNNSNSANTQQTQEALDLVLTFTASWQPNHIVLMLSSCMGSIPARLCMT